MFFFCTMRSIVPANKIEVAIQVAFRNGKKHNSVRILAVEMQCWLCPHKRRTSNDHHHRMAVACLGLGRKKAAGMMQYNNDDNPHTSLFLSNTHYSPSLGREA